MKNLKRWLFALSVALLAPAVASAALNAYLQIKDAKGGKRVVQVENGTCTVEGLAPGTYSVLVCNDKGSVIPSELALDYSVITAREAGSGMASGRRQHQPIRITREAATPATNQITIDEAGTRVVISTVSLPAAAADKATKTRSNIQNN